MTISELLVVQLRRPKCHYCVSTINTEIRGQKQDRSELRGLRVEVGAASVRIANSTCSGEKS